MERYARGERAAFAEVYDGVAPQVLAYLLAQTRSATLAEDLLQQTLLQMHRARGTFIAGSAVMPWAFAIGRRLVIDEQRRRRRSVLSTAGEVEDEITGGPSHAEPEGVVAAKQLAHRLEQELARLPAAQRDAFELMRLEGLSHAEAAEALGITVGALKARAHRAYVALEAVFAGGARGRDPGQ